MGRPRTVNFDLPRNMGRDKRGTLRYRRPDTGRYVSFGDLDPPIALALADLLNRAFGPQPARGARHRYAESFRRFDWPAVERTMMELATAKCPDIMPFQPGSKLHEQIRHSWAYTTPTPAAHMHGLRTIPQQQVLRPNTVMWVNSLFATTRKNAGKRGIPFAITIEDLAAIVRRSGGRCEVSGLPLSTDRYTERKMIRRPWAPSIDRIDSAAGYTPENCRLVCCAVNFAMSCWGEDVLYEIAKAIARKRIARTVPTKSIREGLGRD